MQQEDRSTRPVNFINFHGMNLLVARHQGSDYIEAKPLCDLAGVNWKTASRTLQEGDNAILYGAKRLLPPEIAGFGSLKTPEDGVLYLRLDRSRMYLARISTDRMRANGNSEGADKVLALQTEWAKVLHDYETHGVAVKAGRSNAIIEALNLHKAKLTAKPEDRAWINHLLQQQLQVLGIPESLLGSPQQQLPLGAEVRHG